MDMFHLFACLLFPLSWYIYTFCRFSFEITPYGEILKVYHPKEDDEVLATKKGFAALLASKLRGKQQESTSRISILWWLLDLSILISIIINNQFHKKYINEHEEEIQFHTTQGTAPCCYSF
jgi:hypothetical protein